MCAISTGVANLRQRQTQKVDNGARLRANKQVSYHTFEGRHEGHHDEDAEGLLLLVRAHDSLKQRIADLIGHVVVRE